MNSQRRNLPRRALQTLQRQSLLLGVAVRSPVRGFPIGIVHWRIPGLVIVPFRLCKVSISILHIVYFFQGAYALGTCRRAVLWMDEILHLRNPGMMRFCNCQLNGFRMASSRGAKRILSIHSRLGLRSSDAQPRRYFLSTAYRFAEQLRQLRAASGEAEARLNAVRTPSGRRGLLEAAHVMWLWKTQLGGLLKERHNHVGDGGFLLVFLYTHREKSTLKTKGKVPTFKQNDTPGSPTTLTLIGWMGLDKRLDARPRCSAATAGACAWMSLWAPSSPARHIPASIAA